MTERKLILFDLDDTLLTTEKTVTQENVEALTEARAAGHILCACTGRSVVGTQRILGEYTELLHYIIAYQGAVLYDSEKEALLAADCPTDEEIMDLLRRFYNEGIYAHTYDIGKILIPRECEDFYRYNAISHEDYVIFADMEELRGHTMPKVIAIDYEHPERLKAFREANMDSEPGHFNSFFSQPMYLEYCKEGVHKGSGLQLLAARLGIPVADTIGIGDERNDLTMIETAGVGICVANGRREAKAVADYVTTNDNNHGAVAEAIRKFAPL